MLYPTSPQLSRSSSSSSSSTYYDSSSSTSLLSLSDSKLPCPSPPPTARIPTYEEDASPPPLPASQARKYTRAPHLYFPDGNLILRAENTLFKIFAGLLAARSSVFKDMLAFSPPPPSGEEDETIDGCPVVDVYDEPRDLAVFLRAVFDSSYYEPPPAPTTLPTTTSILRLSLKYDIPYLTARALAHLHTTFPTTLTSWKVREDRRTIPPVDNTPFAVMRVAREFGLTWLVPSAVYCVCSHPFEKTLEGAVWRGGVDLDVDVGEDTPREDGEVVEGSGEEKDVETTAAPEPKSEVITLPWPDKKLCILARQRIILAQHNFAQEVLREAYNPPEGCVYVVAERERAAQAAAAGAGISAVVEDAAANANPNAVPITFHGNGNAAPAAPAPPPPAPQAQPVPIPINAPVPPAPQIQPAVPAPIPPPPQPQSNSQCTQSLTSISSTISSWDMAGMLDYFEDSLLPDPSSPSYSPHNAGAAHNPNAPLGNMGGNLASLGLTGVERLCPACKHAFAGLWRRGCESFWEDLPRMVSMDESGEGWAALERERGRYA